MKRRRQRPGFLLIVVIGMLAVLLTICVGFLSYTRGEVSAVAHQRDKCDNSDIVQTAVDWTVSNMVSDLFNAGTFDSTKFVSNSVGPDRTWWYTPFEPKLKTWYAPNNGLINDKANEAPWIYLPDTYFPDGAVRGRFAVQVLDANAVININDWNEDCIPTQCQMAHMFMDAFGDRQLERYRAFRDGGKTAWDAGWNNCPLRYHEAWRVVTRTTRYLDWAQWYSQAVDNLASYNWVTSNQCWMGLYGPDMAAIKPIIQSDGIPQFGKYPSPGNWAFNGSQYYLPVDPPDGANNWSPWNWPNPSGYGGNNQNVGNLSYDITGVTLMAGVDPDTGRSPVNVNTVWNSGETLPMHAWGSNGSYTMEAVFNIESLRRIVKVGNVAQIGKDVQAVSWKTIPPTIPPAPPAPPSLSPADRVIVEGLKTKLAYQYQETLCRYFTGTYSHGGRLYNPYNPAATGTYASTYTTVLPSSAVGITDYSKARFPYSVQDFRTRVKADLLAMCAGTPEIVDFDGAGNPINVPQGKIDRRTAAAIYDNIVPGKPANLLADFGILVDPLIELYNVGRKEDFDDKYNNYGYWSDNGSLRALSRYTGGDYPSGTAVNMKDSTTPTANDLTLMPKGMDFAKAGTGPKGGAWEESDEVVPHRQRAFSPDCFSTELTTTANTFFLIINAEQVDSSTVIANPTDPYKHRDIFWTQYGVVVELCPDIIADSTTPPGVGQPGEFGWYQSNQVKQYKTAPEGSLKGMDYKCASLVTTNFSTAGDRVSGVGAYPKNYSKVLDWKADIRGIPDAKMGLFYTAANQTKKRIIIRAIWALNTGTMR